MITPNVSTGNLPYVASNLLRSYVVIQVAKHQQRYDGCH